MFGNFDKFDVFSVFKTSSGRPLAAPEWSSLPSVEYTQGSAWTHNLNSFVTGSLPITFAKNTGALPLGITLNADGSFSGTVTDSSGTGSITYTATNSEGTDVSGTQAWSNLPMVVREGELFTFSGLGDMTGNTGLTIDGVVCTSVIFTDILNGDGTAIAPNDGVRYGDPVAIRGVA